MLFCTLTLALAVALKGNNLMTTELGGLLAIALVPAMLGMVTGQWLRRRISEQLFRRVFFISLLVARGLYRGAGIGAVGIRA